MASSCKTCKQSAQNIQTQETSVSSMETPMKIISLKKKSISKTGGKITTIKKRAF